MAALQTAYRIALAATVVVALGGCVDEPTRPGAKPSQASGDAISAPPARSAPSGERLFAELADRVPTSAGFYFASAEQLVANVASAEDGPAAVAVVREFLLRKDIVVPKGTAVRIGWRRVQHAYTKLATLRNLVYDSAFSLQDELVSLDLDEARNIVSLGARAGHRTEKTALVSALLTRHGADTTALEVVEREDMRLTSPFAHAGYFTWQNLGSQGDPVVAGLQVGDAAWGCTIGLTADYPSGGGRGFLTASHCTKVYGNGTIWSVDGFVAHQSSFLDAAGTEVGDPPPWGCGIFHLCRRSDAAFYASDAGRVMERGLIAHPSELGAHDVDSNEPYFIVVGSNNGVYGQAIWKIGATTGWQAGTVNGTCIDHNISGLLPDGKVRTVRCANEATNYNDEGDSGGPLFLPGEGPYVYFSGMTIGRPEHGNGTKYSTISQIQLDFANSLGIERTAGLPSPVQGSGAVSNGHPALSWGAVTGAASYEIWRGWCGQWQYFSKVIATNFVDTTVDGAAVVSSQPPCGTPQDSYYIVARSLTDFSLGSNQVHFTAAPPDPDPLNVTITGQNSIAPYTECQWVAVVSGGVEPYVFSWTANSVPLGETSETVTYGSPSPPFTLGVTATDAVSSHKTASFTVSLDNGAWCM